MNRPVPGKFFILALTALLGVSRGTALAGEALPPCPPGWAHDNWYDPDVQTPKYVVGRILAAHPHTPEGLRQALPAVSAAFPGSKIVPASCLQVLHTVVRRRSGVKGLIRAGTERKTSRPRHRYD